MRDHPPEAAGQPGRHLAIRVISVLLMLQALGLLGLGLYQGAQIEVPQAEGSPFFSFPLLELFLLSGLFVAVGLFAALNAISFYRLQRGAWLRAMIVQGVLLLVCLGLYVGGRRASDIYAIMLYCIIMVLYMNSEEIRLAFYRRDPMGTYREP